MHKNLLIFFVYPRPMGSEEPSQLAGELGAAKINLLPSQSHVLTPLHPPLCSRKEGEGFVI